MYELEEIIESIVNGQRKQALAQLKDSDKTFMDLLEELEDRSMSYEILTMTRVALNNDYLVSNF